MQREEIISLVKDYISQSQQGLEIEHPKFDFKSRWYDLKSIAGISEFLKDTSAIANTFGLDGFVVIGFNDKENTFSSSPFSTSGLSDTSAIPDLVTKHVDRQYPIDYYETTIEDNTIGILHLAPSIDKPHVIRNYKVTSGKDVREESNKIFIRKGSQTRTANKHDIELMFYDRKNIVPDYDIHISFHSGAFKQDYASRHSDTLPIHLKIVLNIENAGRRPAAICRIDLTLGEFADASVHELYEFSTLTGHNMLPIVVQSGAMEKVISDFYSLRGFSYEKAKETFTSLQKNLHRLPIRSLRVQLTNGQEIQVKLEITN